MITSQRKYQITEKIQNGSPVEFSSPRRYSWRWDFCVLCFLVFQLLNKAILLTDLFSSISAAEYIK